MGEYFFLSNFAPCQITHNNIIFATSEHFYQASKTVDKEEQRSIILASTPQETKKLGKKVTLRPDWETVKINVMKYIIFLKFTQNIKINKKLLATNDAMLIEGNYWHDNFWGNCTCDLCQNILGQNKLGRLLMFTRYMLTKGTF